MVDWLNNLNCYRSSNLIKNLPRNHLVEAGATLSRSDHEGLVDELILYIAPKLMGNDGRGLLGDLGLTSLNKPLTLILKRSEWSVKICV